MTRLHQLVATVLVTAFVGCASQPKAPPPGDFGNDIQAALQRGFSGQKAKSLSELAKAPLNQAEQTYLVDSVTTADMFSSDKRQVLLALINNPTTTVDTLKYIPVKLNEMALFSTDNADVTTAVSEALQARAAQAPK
ncbi:MAG: hypothetical protein U0572_00525 [Phycisphaerales bacterium]